MAKKLDPKIVEAARNRGSRERSESQKITIQEALENSKRGKSVVVIHAALDILMLNPDFEILRDFSGRDIFVSVTGKTAFTLTDTAIQLFDFNDNYYELDLNGKLLSEQQK